MPDQHLQASPEAVAQLRAAFLAHPIERSALKSAVCCYVDAMKKVGTPIERIIVEIKRLAEVEGGPLHRARGTRNPDDERAAKRLVDDAVSWCIQHYY